VKMKFEDGGNNDFGVSMKRVKVIVTAVRSPYVVRSCRMLSVHNSTIVASVHIFTMMFCALCVGWYSTLVQHQVTVPLINWARHHVVSSFLGGLSSATRINGVLNAKCEPWNHMSGFIKRDIVRRASLPPIQEFIVNCAERLCERFYDWANHIVNGYRDSCH